MARWYAKSPVGSSVVQTHRTWNFRMIPCGRRSSEPSKALAWSQMRGPLDSSSSSSIPK